MPIYEYRCPDCGHEFEQLQRISEDPVKDCPECGKHDVRKLVSRSSFVLKGGGWYKDHYGLKSDGGSSDSAGSESADTSSDSSSATPSSSDSSSGGDSSTSGSSSSSSTSSSSAAAD